MQRINKGCSSDYFEQCSRLFLEVIFLNFLKVHVKREKYTLCNDRYSNTIFEYEFVAVHRRGRFSSSTFASDLNQYARNRRQKRNIQRQKIVKKSGDYSASEVTQSK